MGTILTCADFTAPDINKIVMENPIYLERGDEYYLQMLCDFGVGVSPDYPKGQAVKDALRLYVSMIICRDNMGYTYAQAADGNMSDPYETKYNIYRKDFSEAMRKINSAILTGRSIAGGVASGRILRG
jgi:hypothetical protein